MFFAERRSFVGRPWGAPAATIASRSCAGVRAASQRRRPIVHVPYSAFTASMMGAGSVAGDRALVAIAVSSCRARDRPLRSSVLKSDSSLGGSRLSSLTLPALRSWGVIGHTRFGSPRAPGRSTAGDAASAWVSRPRGPFRPLTGQKPAKDSHFLVTRDYGHSHYGPAGLGSEWEKTTINGVV